MVEILKIKFSESLSNNLTKITVEQRDFLRCLRLMLSTISLMAPTYGTYLLYTTEEEYFKIPVVEAYLRYCRIFLSVWALVSSIVCINLFTAIDLVDTYFPKTSMAKFLKNTLHDIGSFILFGLSFPLSLTVALIFWSLYSYNPDGIYPKELETILPPTLNHLYHSCPPIAALFLLLTTNQRRPSKASTVAATVSFLVGYGIILLGIKLFYGDWIYIAFEVFSFVQMTLFLASALTLVVIFHSLGYLIYDNFRC